MLQDVIDSTRNETKSSAGDKYETGRAMLQIEQDNIRKQLQEALEQKASFEHLPPDRSSKVTNGSLVKTGNGIFFISIALGKTSVAGIAVMSVSARSPLGSKLTGMKTGETATINGRNYTIEEIA